MLLFFLRLWFNTVLAKVVVFPWFATYCNAFIAKPVAFQYFCLKRQYKLSHLKIVGMVLLNLEVFNHVHQRNFGENCSFTLFCLVLNIRKCCLLVVWFLFECFCKKNSPAFAAANSLSSNLILMGIKNFGLISLKRKMLSFRDLLPIRMFFSAKFPFFLIFLRKQKIKIVTVLKWGRRVSSNSSCI